MAGNNTSDVFDDLDAFFSAAASSDPQALEQAAQGVAEAGRAPQPIKSGTRVRKSGTSDKGKAVQPDPLETQDLQDAFSSAGGDLDGKFIAIDPETIAGGSAAKDPLVLVPAHIHTMLPWWAWATIGLGLMVMVAGVVLMPKIALDRLTARLNDPSPANAQSVMRQLVIKGDEQTVGKLYDLAASSGNSMAARLRAVDTLSLIGAADADRALLRLELASGTDSQVREAAIAARKQREAAKTRTRFR